MATFKDNWHWESQCLEEGSENFWLKQDELRLDGKNSETVTGISVIKQNVLDVAYDLEQLANRKGAGRGAVYNKALKRAATRFTEPTEKEPSEQYEDYKILAYIGIGTILDLIGKFRGKKPRSDIANVSRTIGMILENDAKYHQFERELPAYYNRVMKSLEEQMVSSYRHASKTLNKTFKEKSELGWTEWGQTTQIKIGAKVIAIIMKHMSELFFVNKYRNGHKTISYIDTTPYFDDWLAENEYNLGIGNPRRLPTLIPPVDWEKDECGDYVGGYHTPRLRATLPFIKAYDQEHKDFIRARGNPQAHVDAINKYQKTSWSINKELLEIVTEASKKGLFSSEIPQYEPLIIPDCPLPEDLHHSDMTEQQLNILQNWKIEKKRLLTKDRIRKGKMIMLAQAMNIARRMDELYFVYNCDFRGRIYCATTALSPQGPDPVKSLLKFTKGKPMGESGLFWLGVNIANKYGYDKVSYEDRVAWVEDHQKEIEAVANDPLGTGYSFAVEADKPFQFIAACIEWRDADYGNNPEAIGHLPIGLDGSCNGLQHYSAMLRDPIGAKATNLLPSDKPEDIYGEVASVCTKRVTAMASEAPLKAKKWLEVGINRKTAKRPVMTLPYGSTQQSARQYINEYVHDNIVKFNCDEQGAWEYAKYLTPHLWASIGEVVVAASEGMKWLTSSARKVVRSGKVVSWVTPIGFPVMQTYMKHEEVRIETQISGRLQLKVKGGATNIHTSRQSNGVAPNFVHSMDSTHMVMTTNALPELDLAMIHDDYGTHAADTEVLFRTIREQFVTLYDNRDHLQEWANQQENVKLDDKPEMGNLDVKQVLSSEFFFG